MSNVIPLTGPKLVPPTAPYDNFMRTRQAMMRALIEWLATKPSDADALAEVEGTIAIVAQLRLLEAAHV